MVFLEIPSWAAISSMVMERIPYRRKRSAALPNILSFTSIIAGDGRTSQGTKLWKLFSLLKFPANFFPPLPLGRAPSPEPGSRERKPQHVVRQTVTARGG